MNEEERGKLLVPLEFFTKRTNRYALALTRDKNKKKAKMENY